MSVPVKSESEDRETRMDVLGNSQAESVFSLTQPFVPLRPSVD